MANSQSPARQFFDTHLVPNYEAWLAQPTDLRLAMNATVSLYHMADHYWHSFSATEPDRVFSTNSSSQFRGGLATRNTDYSLLRDVAEAHKHMKLDRSTRNVTESRQTAIGSTGYGEGGYGTGPYGGGPSVVVVLDDGTKRHLSYSAQVVRKLWEAMLK
jgi:hypothetical protein